MASESVRAPRVRLCTILLRLLPVVRTICRIGMPWAATFV